MSGEGRQIKENLGRGESFLMSSEMIAVPAQIWTSQLKRTIQTGQFLRGTIEQFKALNELDVVSTWHSCASAV